MKKLLFIFCILSIPFSLEAEKKDWGRVSASLESLNHVYVDDADNGFLPVTSGDPKYNYLRGSRYASNNYLKVDYYKGRLSAGLQLEGYFPTTIGYPISESMLSLSNLYVSWTDNDYSVTAGTFYEQLGSGLLFRSWEDRALGLNNAILGARATYKFQDYFSLKAFWGIPHASKVSQIVNSITPTFSLGLSQVNVAAFDFALSLSDCIGWKNLSWSLEGSILNKFEKVSDYLLELGYPRNRLGWSGRMNFDYDGLYFRGEYVGAGKQYSLDKGIVNGSAQLVEFGYNNKGLGVSVTGRRLYYAQQKIQINSSKISEVVNTISYCPALCTQYTYMLTSLTPYVPISGDEEVGGQIDAFYNFRRGTKLGGKRGMKVHANFSTYFSVNRNYAHKNAVMRMWDFSVDVEKQWTKKFKSTFLYSAQDYNEEENGLYIGQSHTIVADLLYKWTSKFSTRLELQYLTSKDYQKDWMAALLEVSLAPHWSVFASDMYNHGGSKMHYYNAGLSYSMRWLRVAAGYGRYRAGFICSGGVCREIPAYTGANITLTATF